MQIVRYDIKVAAIKGRGAICATVRLRRKKEADVADISFFLVFCRSIWELNYLIFRIMMFLNRTVIGGPW